MSWGYTKIPRLPGENVTGVAQVRGCHGPPGERGVGGGGEEVRWKADLRNTAEGGGHLERTVPLLVGGLGDRCEPSMQPTREARRMGDLLADLRIPEGPTPSCGVRHEKWPFLPIGSCHLRLGRVGGAPS